MRLKSSGGLADILSPQGSSGYDPAMWVRDRAGDRPAVRGRERDLGEAGHQAFPGGIERQRARFRIIKDAMLGGDALGHRSMRKKVSACTGALVSRTAVAQAFTWTSLRPCTHA